MEPPHLAYAAHAAVAMDKYCPMHVIAVGKTPLDHVVQTTDASRWAVTREH